MTDTPPEDFGYWQASDGLWYPPELHPFHHRARPAGAPSGPHLPHRQAWVEPAHRRPGAGAYTAVPVRRSLGTGARVAVATVLMVVLGAAGVGLLAVTGVIGDDDLTSDDAAFEQPTPEVCASQRTALEVAIFNYKATRGQDPTDERALVSSGYLDELVELWDFTVDPAVGPVLTGVDGC